MEITGSLFENGYSSEPGGAVSIQQSEAVVKNTNFLNNSSPKGGAISASSESTLVVDSSTFKRN